MPQIPTAVTMMNWGLFYDRPRINIPVQGLSDGYNFRIKNGVVSNQNIGWERLSSDWTLNGPVMAIIDFRSQAGSLFLLFVTTTDIYLYDEVTDTVQFRTPIYATGTASASGTAVTGIGTDWSAVSDANAKPGDEISFGSATEDDPGATWYEIQSVTNDTALILTTSAGVIGAGPYTIRRKLTGALHDCVDWETFVHDGDSGDDLLFITNGIERVATWNGVDQSFTYHPELGFRCSSLGAFSNMMIYGNIIEDSLGSFTTSIINSDVGLPLHAGSTGTGLSEQFQVHDGADEILALKPLGDYMVAYSTRHVVPFQFVGDPLIFLFRVAVTDFGAIGVGAVADFGDYHEFIGQDGQYFFDGAATREIHSHVWRYIIRQSDPNRQKSVFCHFDEENGDLLWSVPATTDAGAGDQDVPPVTAWGEHYLESVPEQIGHPHSVRAFPFTASGYFRRGNTITWATALGTWEQYNFGWNDQFFQLAFPQSLVGDVDGNIYILNERQDAPNLVLPSFVRTGRRATGTGRERNLLTRVYPFEIESPNTMNVTVYISDHMEKGATNAGVYPFDANLTEGGHFVSPYHAGRYFELAFGTTGEMWGISGYDIDIRYGGLR